MDAKTVRRLNIAQVDYILFKSLNKKEWRKMNSEDKIKRKKFSLGQYVRTQLKASLLRPIKKKPPTTIVVSDTESDQEDVTVMDCNEVEENLESVEPDVIVIDCDEEEYMAAIRPTVTVTDCDEEESMAAIPPAVTDWTEIEDSIDSMLENDPGVVHDVSSEPRDMLEPVQTEVVVHDVAEPSDELEPMPNEGK
ncbi:hypothetical protein GWI33_012874 [Rhynchophorus ferrugineus]|uniref:Uncharacterized protein n=1 Tax=Rhynchophorus ferrugineus TaxID=354439 RepID=A0A834I4U6_RHYFE|nr:hypothetical protein GWI33_012874 [Rhynchophorus ferrugineus]